MNKIYVLMAVAIVIIPVEMLWVSNWHKGEKRSLLAEYDSKRLLWEQKRKLQHERDKKELADEHEKDKYLATGRSVYDRIYNKENQTISDLIRGLAEEAFPNTWESTVTVEEFTNFMLLVHTTEEANDVALTGVAKFLTPVVSYSAPYIKNVAVFDKNHKCFLYFDETDLQRIGVSTELTKERISEIKKRGEEFSRYNSVQIPCKTIDGHLFVQTAVSGEYGVDYECVMMLDTGASMTVISVDLAHKTGQEDLNVVRRESFSTAKGILVCPVVQRRIVVSGIEMNPIGEMNLLGIDFFKGKSYTIDSRRSCIYVWNE